jgi:ClpP class serine protease
MCCAVAHVRPGASPKPSRKPTLKRSCLSRRSAQLLDEVKRARSATLKANVDYGSGEIWRDQEAKDIGLVDGISTLVVATTWGLKTYDFAPSQDTFGLFSTSLEGLAQKIGDSLASRLAPSLR